MPWTDRTISAFESAGVDTVAYIPDTALWPLISRAEDSDDIDAHVVAREEEAIGVLSGAWLGGRRGALICQSTGLSNTFNALTQLSKPGGLPFVGIVSRRGDLNEHNPTNLTAGYGMPTLLDTIGIRNHSISDPDEVEPVLEGAINTAFSTQEPYVLLLEKQLFGDGE